MIYAILFNLYHQKYLCSKSLAGQTKEKEKQPPQQQQTSSKSSSIVPEVLVTEWIWSPQNEYKKPDLVAAVQLPWAVPTIQRLWFGMAFEDKQRRMKAFLTVMRSDTPLMLNRTYVPQHMLVLACVLRYIITSPDRKILNRLELDAFLATAFSPDINNVDFTQELVVSIHIFIFINLQNIAILNSLFCVIFLIHSASGSPFTWCIFGNIIYARR